MGVTLVAALVLGACGSPPPPPPLPAYDAAAHAANVQEWRAWRHRELVKPDGWLALAGLYWLQPGTHAFGSDPEGDLVYSRDGVPPLLGTFEVTGQRVEFVGAAGIDVEIVDEAGAFAPPVVYDQAIDADVPSMRWGDLVWYVIRREDHLALRLKDGASPLLVNFEGMDNFELAPQWRFDATFEVHDPPKKILIPNVFGTLEETDSPGAVVFEHEGTTYRLDMWKDSDDPANFFTAFGDATNGDSSYGAGRFLWVDAPDRWGRTVVDFNRSYNPPCAFTAFATCPLPPVQNRLPPRIEAGERAFGHEVHTVAGPPAEAQ